MTKLFAITTISLISVLILVPWFFILATPLLILSAVPMMAVYQVTSLLLKPKAEKALPKVLVVDDDEASVSSILALLSRRHANVTYVATGMEALGRLRSETFDIVVLDYLLPDINGDSILDLQKEKAHRPLPEFDGVDAKLSTTVLFHTSSPQQLGYQINRVFGSFVVKDVFAKGCAISSIRRRLDQELAMVS